MSFNPTHKFERQVPIERMLCNSAGSDVRDDQHVLAVIEEASQIKWGFQPITEGEKTIFANPKYFKYPITDARKNDRGSPIANIVQRDMVMVNGMPTVQVTAGVTYYAKQEPTVNIQVSKALDFMFDFSMRELGTVPPSEIEKMCDIRVVDVTVKGKAPLKTHKVIERAVLCTELIPQEVVIVNPNYGSVTRFHDKKKTIVLAMTDEYCNSDHHQKYKESAIYRYYNRIVKYTEYLESHPKACYYFCFSPIVGEPLNAVTLEFNPYSMHNYITKNVTDVAPSGCGYDVHYQASDYIVSTHYKERSDHERLAVAYQHRLLQNTQTGDRHCSDYYDAYHVVCTKQHLNRLPDLSVNTMQLGFVGEQCFVDKDIVTVSQQYIENVSNPTHVYYTQLGVSFPLSGDIIKVSYIGLGRKDGAGVECNGVFLSLQDVILFRTCFHDELYHVYIESVKRYDSVFKIARGQHAHYGERGDVRYCHAAFEDDYPLPVRILLAEMHAGRMITMVSKYNDVIFGAPKANDLIDFM